MARAELQALDADALAAHDLVITTYGQLSRTPALAAQRWRLAVIDEAQAIKNPAAQQTRAVKKLQAGTRIALTGTPVENRLSDLWSIFDFTHPGLLGSERVFAHFAKRLGETGQYAPLRSLVAPYTAAPEERQADHCRPARQDRGLCLVQPERRAGHALPAGRQGAGAGAGQVREAWSARAWCSRS
jgi:hypothetical protein